MMLLFCVATAVLILCLVCYLLYTLLSPDSELTSLEKMIQESNALIERSKRWVD